MGRLMLKRKLFLDVPAVIDQMVKERSIEFDYNQVCCLNLLKFLYIIKELIMKRPCNNWSFKNKVANLRGEGFF